MNIEGTQSEQFIQCHKITIQTKHKWPNLLWKISVVMKLKITFIQKQYQIKVWTHIYMKLCYYYILTSKYYGYTELLKYRNTDDDLSVFSNIWIWPHNNFLIIIKYDIFIDFWNALPHVPSRLQYPDSCMQHTHVEEIWVLWQWPLGPRYSTLLGKGPVQQLLTKHMQQKKWT